MPFRIGAVALAIAVLGAWQCALASAQADNVAEQPGREVDGVPRTSCANCDECKGAKHIVIPRDSYTVKDKAFYNCQTLESVRISEKVMYIGPNAFASTNIKEIYIPDNVNNIGDGAFSGCMHLEKVRLSPALTTIPKMGFAVCPRLGNVDMSELSLLHTIFDKAFTGSKTMTSVVIPDTVVIIGEAAFYGNAELVSIEIPGTVQQVKKAAFWSTGCCSDDFVCDLGAGTKMVNCLNRGQVAAAEKAKAAAVKDAKAAAEKKKEEEREPTPEELAQYEEYVAAAQKYQKEAKDMAKAKKKAQRDMAWKLAKEGKSTVGSIPKKIKLNTGRKKKKTKKGKAKAKAAEAAAPAAEAAEAAADEAVEEAKEEETKKDEL